MRSASDVIACSGHDAAFAGWVPTRLGTLPLTFVFAIFSRWIFQVQFIVLVLLPPQRVHSRLLWV